MEAKSLPKNCKLILAAKQILISLVVVLVVVLLLLDGPSWTRAATTIGKRQISMRMPDIRPDHGEQYLCMAHRIKHNQDGEFIVGFEPRSDSHRVHHILLYGCLEPGILQSDSPEFVWDCGMMHATSQTNAGQTTPETSFEQGPVCKDQTQILYGWAMDAPALNLPEGVGFKIGGLDSNIKHLVMQVHYGQHAPFDKAPDLTDNSGIILSVHDNNESSGITKRAGVLLLSSLGQVDVGRNKHEIWCDIDDEIVIHPFRFRVHTHKLGTKVFGAKIGTEKDNELGLRIDQAELVGAGDPREAQMFYPVRNDNITIQAGDKIYAACEFNNNLSHPVKIGMTGDDEMCNFYIMYWTDSERLLRGAVCVGANPLGSELADVNALLI